MEALRTWAGILQVGITYLLKLARSLGVLAAAQQRGARVRATTVAR